MRLSVFDGGLVGVWGRDETIVDITPYLDPHVRAVDRMNWLIGQWSDLRPAVEEAATRHGRLLSDVTLRAPQPRPSKIVAAPVNYRDHQVEMGGEAGVYKGADVKTVETYVGFLKAPSSIVGPDGAIELPYADRRVDHEGELGVVIGRRASRVRRVDALDYVFGYVPLLDVTLRGEEDRAFRKSFDTFTPIGPAIVTSDELPDSRALAITLTVNGDVRQSARTSELIFDVPRLIETYTAAMTLEPGDLIATGTPRGVGRLEAGDDVRLSIEGLPELAISVADRAARNGSVAPRRSTISSAS